MTHSAAHLSEFDEAYWTQVVARDPQTPNELHELFKLDCNDPRTRWSFEREQAQSERLIPRPCEFGRCTELWDPVTNRNTGGFGPAGCPCAN